MLRKAQLIVAGVFLGAFAEGLVAQSPRSDSLRIESDRVTAPQDAVPGDLRGRVGADFTEPPPVPPVPESLTEAMFVSGAAPLTIEAIESFACSRNPTLTQAQAQTQGELGKAIQAGLIPNPTLRYAGEQWGVEGTAGEWQGLEFSQRLVTAKKLQLSRAKFLQMTRASQWRALEQEYQVLNDVRMSFWMTLGQQSLVQIHGEILKNAEDAVLTARELYNEGQATRDQLHEANVMLQKARLDLLMTRNQLRAKWYELASLAGMRMQPTQLVGSLEGTLALIDFEQSLERLTTESPQILAARAKLQADEIKVKRETVEPIPDVVITYGYGRNFEAGQNTHNTGLSLELPLYNWNQGTIRQAEADVMRQRGEIERIEFFLQRQLAHAYQNYLTAMQNVRSYQEVILPESRRAYEVLLDAYKANRVAWPAVLQSQRNLYREQSSYVQHLVAWRSQETLITGFLLQGGLTPPTGPTPSGHISATPDPR